VSSSTDEIARLKGRVAGASTWNNIKRTSESARKLAEARQALEDAKAARRLAEARRLVAEAEAETS